MLLTGECSDRLIYRKVRQSDFKSWLPFFVDMRTSEHWVMEHQPAEQGCIDWYEKQFHRYQNQLGGMNALIEKSSGQLVGHCGLLVQTVDGERELEIGYSLLPAFWKQGFAIEAARKTRDFAFQHDLAPSLVSIISVTNLPSMKVATANGMTVEKTTEYHHNTVNIFRIWRDQWSTINSSQ